MVSQPPLRLKGTKTKLTPTHELAEKLNIPILTPEKASDPLFIEAIEEISPDLCITAAYGNFLPKKFLSIPKFGTVNIHPSLLPKYRGSCPLQYSLLNGDTTVGVSVLFTILKMDAGPIISQEKLILQGNEKYNKVLSQLFHIGAVNLLSVLPNIWNKTVSTQIQDENEVSFAHKLLPSMKYINITTMSAMQIKNHVRACCDSIGSWITITKGPNNTPYKIKLITTIVMSNSDASSDSNNQEAHTDRELKYTKLHNTELFTLTCGDGSVLGILELQPDTKSVMSAKAFYNGLSGQKIQWVENITQ